MVSCVSANALQGLQLRVTRVCVCVCVCVCVRARSWEEESKRGQKDDDNSVGEENGNFDLPPHLGIRDAFVSCVYRRNSEVRGPSWSACQRGHLREMKWLFREATRQSI